MASQKKPQPPEPTPSRRENDASYRNLFNHKIMVEWLLRRYVAQPWLGQLDFSTLQPVKTHFVGSENQHRESDLVWRARLQKTGEWFYVYLLIEFQSTPERFMALRVLGYICLLYEDLLRQKLLTQSRKLPPILPVVLYNGRRPWRKPVQIADLIEPVEGGLDTHVPRFEYLVLDESHLPKGSLEPVDNPVTAVFQVEQVENLDELRRSVGDLIHLLEGREMDPLRRDMVTWLRRVILPVLFPGESFPELQGLKETEEMLAERVKEWPKQWKAEGLREGIEKGLAQGLEQGMEQGLERGMEQGLEQGKYLGLRRALELQLEQKFGPLAPTWDVLIRGASEEQLVEWLQRLLTAESIDQVLNG